MLHSFLTVLGLLFLSGLALMGFAVVSVIFDLKFWRCFECAGTGFVPCPTCGAGLDALYAEPMPPCPRCQRRNRIMCDECVGRGRVTFSHWLLRKWNGWA